VRVFDRIDPRELESREWALWLLALAALFVFASGIVLLMYPTVFLDPLAVAGATLPKVFFGFCTLTVLLMAYLVNRQAKIAQARREIAEEQDETSRLRQAASANLLGSLPDLEHFHARLRMEYSRSLIGRQPLSLVVVALKSSATLASASEVFAAFAASLIRKLRSDDAVYLFGPGVFCIMLPAVTSGNASSIANRLKEGLSQAGAGGRFSFEVQVFNYPEQVKTVRDIEEAIRPFVPRESAPAAPTP
jgi:GGDEF domain-containing protein